MHPNSSTSIQDQVSVSKKQTSLVVGDLESELQSQAPGSSMSSEPLSLGQERMSPIFKQDFYALLSSND